MIEQAFLERLTQNATDHRFNFKVKDHEYYLVFHPEEGMHQVNVQYGTKRQVKRRPERPLSPDEFTILNRLDAQVTRRQGAVLRLTPAALHMSGKI